eukprot:CAMPEP_0116009288 /NCGR_PEP_ID=MMETSP0321-20121206/3347_1 /TAXON_ID=163516 /ORGANISM="Leptocylindrus danicus var. danicus, Strain B650" /LENGTH=169 /DNA_ID=CAMNT_0003478229 /DNA_START=110 /DNA_END=619 /DNA_ORIENTATION=+
MYITSALNLYMMGRPRKGNLKKQLTNNPSPSSPKAMNQGKGQEITGVTLPEDMKVKGWELGNEQRMACANVGGQLFALEGICPRCGFDLWKGTVICEEAFGSDPVLACPTCSTTYNLKSGKYGPPFKRNGLAGFVSGLAQSATPNTQGKDAKCYVITRDDEGKVYCRPR